MKILRGTSIIEIIIATALISVAIIAALSLTNSSQKQNTSARKLAEASRYGTQGADWIREQRDTLGWQTLASKCNNICTYCLNNIPVLPNDFLDLSQGSCIATSFISATDYQRNITLDTTNKANGSIKFSIVVSWLEKITRQTTIEMELTQWN